MAGRGPEAVCLLSGPQGEEADVPWQIRRTLLPMPSDFLALSKNPKNRHANPPLLQDNPQSRGQLVASVGLAEELNARIKSPIDGNLGIAGRHENVQVGAQLQRLLRKVGCRAIRSARRSSPGEGTARALAGPMNLDSAGTWGGEVSLVKNVFMMLNTVISDALKAGPASTLGGIA